jgi:hypothetical protein
MCVATFLSLDAEKRAIFAVVVKTQIGHAGLANNAYLLLSFHRYKRRTALGPYWPRAYRTGAILAQGVPHCIAPLRTRS